jgi:hypothetical protein
MRKRNYIIIGSNEPNTAKQISAFRVTPKVIEIAAKEWKHHFPYVSYFAVNLKHSKILYESEEEK